MRAVIKIEADEDVKVAFVLPDGSTVTVHFCRGELRACGTTPIVAEQHRDDVLRVLPAAARASAV